PSWEAAVLELRRRIEDIGVLVVVNGVVGNNTHRKLDVEEFRGFALADPYAPLIFVNGADAKSAQMFTLAHELAHLWLGPAGEGLSGYDKILQGDHRVERFCDRAAAEFLVPGREFKAHWPEVKR
ncbi:ImmA/IrrE family metallo-endopeptidase, partial [Pelomicrobium sp. G1]|uniref:ImmA/IrrE family metallo-endopeptidase n=1 Tax=Pelomicrobium sp. G1 TaxID=3452920 RepID=UPI003F774787